MRKDQNRTGRGGTETRTDAHVMNLGGRQAETWAVDFHMSKCTSVHGVSRDFQLMTSHCHSSLSILHFPQRWINWHWVCWGVFEPAVRVS